MHTRVGYAAVLSVVAVLMTAPVAMATYNTWGTLYDYEGSTLVAEGKGTIGVDFNLDVIGGHVGSLDPRPGGSPAYGEIGYNYTQPSYHGPTGSGEATT